MIAQYLLTAMMVAISLYYVALRGAQRHRIAVVLGAAIATFLIWDANVTTTIAHMIGIGRGLDLVLPIFCLLLLFLIVALYRKIIGLQDDLTALCRQLAINDARTPTPPEYESK
ncbi:DUF2304 domain-containing protein [Pandoraea soli]|uniref:DUF2304 domain-containing protein n=1 Tax=Pandoraea soli TaxID=2508293 RepID=A0ABY6W6M4_9BURK|nr:DUF2304 domain-containing protein [Pandoraea soli]VVE32828.1 hypothetical protein PSO31014_03728 [Pandoraea soli]